jgi:hypothetical protein
MNEERMIVIRIRRRDLVVVGVGLAFAFALLVLPGRALAQKAQQAYKDAFSIAEETGGIALATSSDGQYVYFAGPRGVMVSEDHGKTGSWVQTVRVKD